MQAQCLGRRKRMKYQNQKRSAENYTMNYDCTLCGRQYRYKESLLIHMNCDHGGTEMEHQASTDFDAVDRSIIEKAIENVVENGTADEVYNTSQA